MAAYYNEYEPYAAEWLRNLIKNGLIADGDVDERSILDVAAADLRGYTQCHFFAGIGVWSYALRLAGWPDDRPVWTGSCPCQPFSAAGKGKGFEDERHLWPIFHRLIAECRPPVVFGEQVASKDGLGWLDAVHADLEASGYAIGAADLCAAGVGAPHIRQRLWFVGERLADAAVRREPGGIWQRGSAGGPAGKIGGHGSAGGLANADSKNSSGRRIQRPGQGDGASDGAARERFEGLCADGGLADASRERRDGKQVCLQSGEQGQTGIEVAGNGRLDGLANASNDGSQGRVRRGAHEERQALDGSVGCDGADRRPRPTNGLWRDADWLHCRDGKWRSVEPGTFPLAHGAPARVGRLRAYGNAIVPQVAAEVIGAFLDARP